jgi:hypothetical protein
MIPMFMGIKHMRYLMVWKGGFNKGKYYCWIGWVNKDKAILCSSLHHIRIIILEERKGNDFVISFEIIHDIMIL